ncbi:MULTISPECIES: hypothetical protein [Cyanophyceae]|nr:hypothetical protein [Trichocoleus sp. FACHB-69]MBD1934243.1 hypothetical protein [Trichocoleus sp. FACHB-69]
MIFSWLLKLKQRDRVLSQYSHQAARANNRGCIESLDLRSHGNEISLRP